MKATAADVGAVTKRDGWSEFAVKGLATPAVPGAKRQVGQRARLTAFPTYTQGVRPAFETVVLDVDGGRPAPTARSSTPAAARCSSAPTRSSRPPTRRTAAAPSAATPATARRLRRPAPIAVKSAYSVGAFATANVPSDDIVLKLIGPDGKAVASSDTASSPEAVNYSNDGAKVADGTYQVVVCAFDDPTVPASGETFAYTGGYAVNNTAATPSAAPATRRGSSSRPRRSARRQPQGRLLPERDGLRPRAPSPAEHGPWDAIPTTGTPSFTTQGNAARTAEARTSPLTPGPFGFMPISVDRSYQFPWANQWATSKCDPTPLVTPGSGADLSASVANLFSGHNRFHDFAYHLGFTEGNYNLQQSNFGATEPGRDGDPEIGNVQAGRADRRPADVRGPRQRQPGHARWTASPASRTSTCSSRSPARSTRPCVDGDLDTSVFGHEYTHAISNRMVGGPDDSLSGLQAGAMGESWSDQVALEYLHAHGYVPQDGENPWAEGPYVTGNKKTGIRDYALDANPLNYSDIGFDTCRPGGARRRRDLERRQLRHPAGAGEEVRRAVPVDRPRAAAAAAPTAGRARPRRRRRCRPSSARATAAGSRSCSTPSCSSRATRAC